jgi:septal ring factor EnvC (AmiA/AmiB activator)
MSAKQLQSRLVKLNERIKTRSDELAKLRQDAKDLKTKVAEAKAQEKAKAASKSNNSN